MKKLHNDLNNSGFNHLFELIKTEEVKEMEKHIGLKCIFINVDCEIKKQIFEIGSVQRNYKNQLCYRVYFNADTFGRVAHQSEIMIQN